MKRLFLAIASDLDQRAAYRAGFGKATDEPLPLPLHELRCATVLRLEYGTKEAMDLGYGPIDYSIDSYAFDEFPERDIIAATKHECAKADHFITFSGAANELPILFNRALVHGINPNVFTQRHVRHATARFSDGSGGVQSSPASLCAALRIPFAQWGDGDIDQSFKDERTLAKHCEKFAVSSWLLDEFWRHGDDPLMLQTRWGMFAGWVEENENLSHLRPFVATSPGGVVRPSELRASFSSHPEI